MGRQAGGGAGAVVVVHVGLGLGLAVGILGEVGVHDSGSGGRGSIVIGAHPHVVKDGAGIGLQMVVQVVGEGVGVVGGQRMGWGRLARGASAWRRARLGHLI